MLLKSSCRGVARRWSLHRGALCSARWSSGHSVFVSNSNGDPIILTTGHMARFAAGAVVASVGDNAVLATCVHRPSSNGGQGFVPLTVDYRQSAAAIGKIPTNYLRREMAQSDADIINSRIIDRTLRPLFPQQWSQETQILCKPLSIEEGADGVLLGLNAAATALHLSPIPFDGPVAAVRVGLCGSEIMVNPCGDARRESRLDLVMAGCGDKRTVMIEMDGREIPLSEMESVFDTGLAAIDKVLVSMNQLREQCGKEKIELVEETDNEELLTKIERLAEERLYYILTDSTHDKLSRDDAIKELGNDIKSTLDDPALRNFSSVYSQAVKNMLRTLVVRDGIRCDGRSQTQFRPIVIGVDVYKKLHGSALFQRGQTQVLSTVTFDSPASAFHPDSVSQLLGAQRKKMFMLHYEFPAFATNDISTGRGANRRELGHGALAEKAIKHVIPNNFPYCIRLAAQVLESNGSSSMAAVCGGSLALYDAGVPLKAPVAGVAIGLMTGADSPDSDYKVLTDILGIEDYAGDMDFKIAGSSSGFTAMQLDVKIGGLTRAQLSESMRSGQGGIEHVLQKMAVMRDRPRSEFKSSVPVLETMKLEVYKRQILFRNGGFNAKLIESETGVKVTVDDDSHISLFAPNRECLERAKKLMNSVLSECEQVEFAFGQMIQADILEMVDRGVMVNVHGMGKPVFVPNSQIHPTPVSHSSATGLKVGQRITLQFLGRDTTSGKIRLSRRTLTGATPPKVQQRS